MISFKFKHEGPKADFHPFDVPHKDISGTTVSWQRLRYALEFKFNMHKSVHKANPIYAFLIGSIDGVKLTELCYVFLGSQLLLQRRPMVAALGHKQFKPNFCSFRLQDVLFTADMDELARMEALANAGIDTSVPLPNGRSIVHASTLPQSMEDLATFEGTINKESQWCRACNEVGHLSAWCPKKTDASFVPLHKRQRPLGIPSSELRLAVTEEEKIRAFLSRDNQLLVFKKEHSLD